MGYSARANVSDGRDAMGAGTAREEETVRKASTKPCPSAAGFARAEPKGRVLRMSADLISSGCNPGCRCRSNAATPVTTAVALEVPDSRKYVAPLGAAVS